MSFEPTEPETTRPTTEAKPLVPIQPEETQRTAPPTEGRTVTEPHRPPRTDYAAPYTRDREEIVPGVAPHHQN